MKGSNQNMDRSMVIVDWWKALDYLPLIPWLFVQVVVQVVVHVAPGPGSGVHVGSGPGVVLSLGTSWLHKSE